MTDFPCPGCEPKNPAARDSYRCRRHKMVPPTGQEQLEIATALRKMYQRDDNHDLDDWSRGVEVAINALLYREEP